MADLFRSQSVILPVFVTAIVVCLVQGQNITDGTNCTVQIQLPATDSSPPDLLESVVVRIDQLYDSVTNGVTYGPITTHVGDVILPASGAVSTRALVDEDGNQQTLGVAFNGSHVCASVIHLREGEACADIGCTTTDPQRDCGRICFLAKNYGVKSTLDLFTVVKVSSGTGNWRQHDEVSLYSVEQVNRQCYQQADYYYKPSGSAPPPDLPSVTCGVGERCRVTAAYIQTGSDARYYVGCENNDGHLDGCEWEGCRYNVREPIPGSTTHYTFVKVCRYCCTGPLCNDVSKCTGGSCDLSRDSDDSSDAASRGVIPSFITLVLWSIVASIGQ